MKLKDGILILKKYYIFIIPLCLTIVNTSTIIITFTKAFTILMILYFLVFSGFSFHRLLPQQKMWMIIIVFCGFNTLISTNFSSSFSFYAFLVIYGMLFWAKIKIEIYLELFDILKKIFLVCAFSIMLNVVIPNLMTNYLSFLVLPSSMPALKDEVARGYYSGLMAEKAYAAYAMDLGFILEYEEFMRCGKKRNMVVSFIYIGGILVTGKRMLILIPFVIIGFSMLLAGKKETNWKRIAMFLSTILAGVLLMFITVPQTRVVLERQQEATDSGNMLSNRNQVLWPVAYEMAESAPLTGKGLNTYNEHVRKKYADNASLSLWDFQAHNTYVQLLGETGVPGLILFVYAFAYSIISTITTYIKARSDLYKKLLFISASIQIMWLIFGITENCFYYKEQLLNYWVALAMAITVEKEVINDNKSIGISGNSLLD